MEDYDRADYFDTDEAMEALGVSRRKLYDMRMGGEIKTYSHKLKNQIFFLKSEIEELKSNPLELKEGGANGS